MRLSPRLLILVMAVMLTPALTPSIVRAQDMPLSEIIPQVGSWEAMKLPAPVLDPKLTGFDKIHAQVTLTKHPWTYVTVPGVKSIVLMRDKQKPLQIEVPLAEPTAMVAWNDESTLVVADAASKFAWAFRIEADGTLTAGDRYYALRVRKGVERSEASAATIDSMNRVYIATREGVQVFDPIARLCGVLHNPSAQPATKLEILGKPGTLVFRTEGAVFGRPLK